MSDTIPELNEMLFEVEVLSNFVIGVKEYYPGDRAMLSDAQFSELAQLVSIGHPIAERRKSAPKTATPNVPTPNVPTTDGAQNGNTQINPGEDNIVAAQGGNQPRIGS